MGYKVTILKDRGCVVLRYDGHFTVSDAECALEQYRADPDFHPAQKHFIDFGTVTSYQPEILRAMQLQARIAGIVMPGNVETLLVMHAPHAVGRELANMIRKSWDGVAHVVAVIAETEEAAIALLGHRETRIDDLLATAGQTRD